jgi:hypothetical protein
MEQEGPCHYFETYNIHSSNEEETYSTLLEKTFQSFSPNRDETKDKLFMFKHNDFYRILCKYQCYLPLNLYPSCIIAVIVKLS